MFAFTVGSTLNSEMARRALVQSTDTIVESNIDPFILARKAYSKEIISEDVYKVVRDKKLEIQVQIILNRFLMN